MLTTSSILIILAQCSGSVDVGCSSQVCEFQANWTVQGDSVEFSVSAQTTGWVGIGFSDDQFMVSIGSVSAVYDITRRQSSYACAL